MQINILESKNRLSQLVRLALQGEEVIIASRGHALVKLVPVASGAASRRDVLAWLEAHPLPTHARRDHAHIESDIQAEREAWG